MFHINKLYSLKIDANLDVNLKNLESEINKSREKIIKMVTENGYLIIATEIFDFRSNNLLLEEHNKKPL